MEVEFEHHRDGFADACLPEGLRPHGPIDFRLLRQQIPIEQVLGLVGWTPSRRRGPQLRGPCPIHKSKRPRSRIFSVNTERDVFCCFKCDAKGNQLDLWVALTGLPVYEAAIDLCERLGIEVPRLTGTAEERKP